MLKKSLMCSALLASFILRGQSPRDWRASHEADSLSEYRELLAIPNVTRNLPDMRRNAEMLQRMFAKRGVPLQMLEVPDVPPALFGELRVPGATRVRLVNGMQPVKTRTLVLDHLRREGCFVTEVEPDAATRMAHAKVCYVSDAGQGGGQAAVREPLDSEFAISIVQAVETVRGPVVRQPTLGGTLPLAPITEGLRAPVVVLPIVNHDNNQHTHNEDLRLQNLWDGIETIAAVMTMK